MGSIKEYTEIEIIKALDEGEEILRASVRDVWEGGYEREITIGCIKAYKHSIKRLLGVEND